MASQRSFSGRCEGREALTIGFKLEKDLLGANRATRRDDVRSL